MLKDTFANDTIVKDCDGDRWFKKNGKWFLLFRLQNDYKVVPDQKGASFEKMVRIGVTIDELKMTVKDPLQTYNTKA